MKFSDVECCPFCGSEEFYGKEYVRGFMYCRMRFDGETSHNEDLYDELTTSFSGKVYCSECKRYLGNVEKNTVGKEATKVLERGTSK